MKVHFLLVYMLDVIKLSIFAIIIFSFMILTDTNSIYTIICPPHLMKAGTVGIMGFHFFH